MPNWVFNTLSVSGDKATLDKMVAQLNAPVTKHFPNTNYDNDLQKWVDTPDVQVYNNPVFSFWNVVAPTNLELYYGEEVFKKDVNTDNADGSFNSEAFMQEFVRSMSEDNDWYHWNCRHWGTKWDILVGDDEKYPNTTMEWSDTGDVVYRFQTAWSPVEQVLVTLSEMYPTLTFSYWFEEEQGWGGECEIVNGEVSIIDEWDIPSSHADHEKLDRECNCDIYDEEYKEYWYKDCPVDSTKFEWSEDDEEWVEKDLDSALSNSVQ